MMDGTNSPQAWRGARLAWLCAALFGLCLLTAADARASNIGAGAASGTIAAINDANGVPQGVPPLNAPCARTSFTLQGDVSEAFVFNTAIFGYAGPVTFRGTAGSSCEGTTAGSGAIELTDVRGDGLTPGNSLKCADPTAVPPTKLTGGYTRNGSNVTAVLGGTCLVTGSPAPVQLFFRGQFVPTNPGEGVFEPITAGRFAGAFVISPA